MTTWTDLDAAAAGDRWPVATLDPPARGRALAVGLPGAVVHEVVIDRPIDEVWAFIADLERSVPTLDRDVADLRITRRDGHRLTARTRSPWRVGGLPMRFEIDLEVGWCWMVSQPNFYVVAMAAAPEPGDPSRTRYVHVEGVARRGRLLQPLLRLSRWRSRRHVAHDVAGIAAALDATATPVPPPTR